MINSKIGDEATVETILAGIDCLNKRQEARRE
jgi:hypothetical protein